MHLYSAGEGHAGLSGRAGRAGGMLDLGEMPGSGSEIALLLPRNAAFP
jgi:hypothetical protein